MATNEEKKMIYGAALGILRQYPKYSNTIALQEAIIKCGGINGHITVEDVIKDFESQLKQSTTVTKK